MATQQNNEEFKDLLKMLAWKRHEQPPPGYFDDFAARIAYRIESENHVPTWWQRLSSLLDPKPIYAGAFSLTVCGTLLIGLAFQASPQARQARFNIDEFADAWPHVERTMTKTSIPGHGLAIYHAETSITPVLNTEPSERIWKSSAPAIYKASFDGF